MLLSFNLPLMPQAIQLRFDSDNFISMYFNASYHAERAIRTSLSHHSRPKHKQYDLKVKKSKELQKSVLSHNRSSSQLMSHRAAIVCVKDPSTNMFQAKYDKNSHHERQIASLTKIMTCYVALKFIEQNSLIPEKEYTTVSKEAASIKGTTAELSQGDRITYWDLLFGMMLPSGNDAAFCLAEAIGDRLPEEDQQNPELSKTESQKSSQKPLVVSNGRGASSHIRYRRKDSLATTRPSLAVTRQRENGKVKKFIVKMNKIAKELKMKNTKYNNPHGLPDAQNYSTAMDQFLLVKFCLKNQIFRKIIATKMYFCAVKLPASIWNRQMIWHNTNTLLHQGYKGVKTGNTCSAGFCQASWFCEEEREVIVIVLGCSRKEYRESETIKLTRMGVKEG